MDIWNHLKDMDDPLAGIKESIGYFRGVLACKKYAGELLF
jgi:hypothetical protein